MEWPIPAVETILGLELRGAWASDNDMDKIGNLSILDSGIVSCPSSVRSQILT